jgi:hypothetical protein
MYRDDAGSKMISYAAASAQLSFSEHTQNGATPAIA